MERNYEYEDYANHNITIATWFRYNDYNLILVAIISHLWTN